MSKNWSIGGYTLSDIEEFKGQEGSGFGAVLKRDGRTLAYLEDYGDGGGVNVHFDRTLLKKEIDKTLLDMQSLASKLKPIIKPDSLYHHYMNTPHGVATLISELLLEYKEFVKAANKAYREIGDGQLYVVCSFGGSFFDNNSVGANMVTYFFSTGTNSYDQARAKLMEFVEKYRIKQGPEPLRKAAILTGKMGWNLSFDDYAELCMPWV